MSDQIPYPSPESDASDIAAAFVAALARAASQTVPFAHWRLDRPWPNDLARDLETLPISRADVAYQLGRREENNATRAYFDQDHQARLAACRRLAEALQDTRTTAAIEALCGITLSGSFLRIEYAQDTDGFWLEPHTDIGVKRFTMLAPLSSGPEAATWGTDFYADAGAPPLRQPFQANTAILFVPSDSTWHGFEPRPMNGIRRSLIVNYFEPVWRARHERCFPDRPIA